MVGLDLGGAASMSASAYYWPQTGRLESRGWFPAVPSLGDRAQRDRVANRYLEMAEEGTLRTIGGTDVPAADWIGEVLAHVDGEDIAAVVFDTYKESIIAEQLHNRNVKARHVLRRFGPFDGGEDVERFRRQVHERRIATRPTMLMRSAIDESVCRRDGNLNPCLDKARSLGRIDAAAAAVLAVAEGSRMLNRPINNAGRLVFPDD